MHFFIVKVHSKHTVLAHIQSRKKMNAIKTQVLPLELRFTKSSLLKQIGEYQGLYFCHLSNYLKTSMRTGKYLKGFYLFMSLPTAH